MRSPGKGKKRKENFSSARVEESNRIPLTFRFQTGEVLESLAKELSSKKKGQRVGTAGAGTRRKGALNHRRANIPKGCCGQSSVGPGTRPTQE